MKNVVDFPNISLIEEEASQWIVRFEADTSPSQKDIDELKAWMDRSPAHRSILLRYAALWNDMDLLSELVLTIPRVKKKRLLPAIPVRFFTALLDGFRHLVYSAPKRWAFIAALLIIGWWPLLSIDLSKHSAINGEFVTSVGEQMSTTLDDGSVLWLNTDSRVDVGYTDDERRIVLHRGEAHFSVVRDPARPFVVYANDRVIKAIGTAFSVYRTHQTIRVTVAEGRVELAAIVSGVTSTTKIASPNQGRPNGQINPTSTASEGAPNTVMQMLGTLAAGESAVITKDEVRGGVEGIVHYPREELSRRLSWREGLLIFAGESLHEVVEEVSRYTVITIDIADPELRNLRIGGQFKIGETEALFDVLESGFGLKVSRLDEKHVKIYTGK